MSARVAKVTGKRAMAKGHRPFHVQGSPLKTEPMSDTEDADCEALVDGMSQIRLIDLQ